MPKRKKQLPQCIPQGNSALALGAKRMDAGAYACVSQWKKPDSLKLQQLLVITEKPSPSLQRLLQNLARDEHVSTAIFEPTCANSGCDVSLLDAEFQRRGVGGFRRVSANFKHARSLRGFVPTH